jgi:hypothetical protein
MRRSLALAAVAALAASPPMGRIQGQLVLSPASPVERAGRPNARPIAGRIQVLDGHGKLVTEIAANQQGRFGADLPPGRYTLHLAQPGPPGRAADQPTTINPGETTQTEIVYDAGLR